MNSRQAEKRINHLALIWVMCAGLLGGMASVAVAQEEPVAEGASDAATQANDLKKWVVETYNNIAAETETVPISASQAPKIISRTVDLYVGSVRAIPIRGVQQLAVAREDLLGTTVLDTGELLLIARKPGVTEVIIWHTGGDRLKMKVTIYPFEITERMNTVAESFSGFEGVSVSQAGGSIRIEGNLGEADYANYRKIIEQFPDVADFVTVAEPIQIPVIELDVKILEINRSFQRQLGIRWADTAAGPAFGIVGNIKRNSRFGVVSDTGGGSTLTDIFETVGPSESRWFSYLGITSTLGSEIQLLEETGKGRILSQPRLSTVHGATANFWAGGEVPVAILNEFGQPVVEFKEYGIKLEIAPVVKGEFIRSLVRAEVSTIDFTVQVNGVPGILKRETESVISARDGETIAISGLISANDSKDYDKVPFLGDIPILGNLFKSRDFQQNITELIVLVTPQIKYPGDAVSDKVDEHIYELQSLLGGSELLDGHLAE